MKAEHNLTIKEEMKLFQQFLLYRIKAGIVIIMVAFFVAVVNAIIGHTGGDFQVLEIVPAYFFIGLSALIALMYVVLFVRQCKKHKSALLQYAKDDNISISVSLEENGYVFSNKSLNTVDTIQEEEIVNYHEGKKIIVIKLSSKKYIYLPKTEEIKQVFCRIYNKKEAESKTAKIKIKNGYGWSIVLCVFAVAWVIIGCGIASAVGGHDVFGTYSLNRGSWVIYIFSIFPITSIVFGILLAINKEKYKKNIIAGIIGLILCGALGSIKYIEADKIIHDTTYLTDIEATFNIELPDNVEMVSDIENEKPGVVSFIQVKNEQDYLSLLSKIQQDERWTQTKTPIDNSHIPSSFLFDLDSFEYVMVYNHTTNEYNKLPTEAGEYEISFIGVDGDLTRIVSCTNCKYIVE